MPRKKTTASGPDGPKSPKPKRAPASPKPKAPPKPRAKKSAPKADAPQGTKPPAERRKSAAPPPSKTSFPKIPPRPLDRHSLPRHAETQMVAFIRDPKCLFTYWEVAPESREAAAKELESEFPDSFMALRLLRVGGAGEVEILQETRVDPEDRNLYVELKGPGGSYLVEIGQKAPSGRFLVYARSNRITTAPWGASWPPSGGGGGATGKWDPPEGILEYFSEEWSVEPGASGTPGHSSGRWHSRRRGPSSSNP